MHILSRKINSTEVFGWDSVDEVPKDHTLLTAEEVEAHLNPVPTLEQLQADEREWRDEELKRADVELNKVQDGDSNAVGAVGDWRSYRKALRAYPEASEFPDKAARPVAPDYVAPVEQEGDE